MIYVVMCVLVYIHICINIVFIIYFPICRNNNDDDDDVGSRYFV